MILVTVGIQLPFDRLISAMDRIAPELHEPVLAQNGEGDYRPLNIECRRRIPPVDFDQLLSGARVLVAHAGIGSILSAQRYRKPVILFPRSVALGEHRTGHQSATVAALEGRKGIHIARDEAMLAQLLLCPSLEAMDGEVGPERLRLMAAVSAMIRGDEPL